MKLKSLVAACAFAFAGQAFALAPTVTPDVTLFISGSSALQNAFGEVSVDMFQNGTAGSATATDEFFDGTATTASGSNFRAYFGVMKAAAPVPTALQGKKVLIYNTAKGGSIYGVNPVALSTTVARLDITTCGTAAVTTDAKTLKPVWSCTGSVTAVPDGGISDVEPATLESAANIARIAGAIPADIGGPLSTAQMASLSGSAIVGQVFAIIVNAATGPKPATTAMVNMSKAQVAAIMSGTITDWNLIDSTVPAGSTSMVICRRQSGSGSQASINAGILGNPCMGAGQISPSGYLATSATLGATSAVAAGSVVVVENASSGNLGHCMTYAQNGTGTSAIDVTTGNIVAAGAANSVVLPAGNYAIGLMGLDHSVGTDLYQNVTLNGVVPSLATAVLGQYDLVVESTMQTRASYPAGNTLSLYNFLVSEISNPLILGGSSGAVVPGILGLSENGYVPTTLGTFTAANPVIQVGNFGNTCAPLQQLQ